MSWRCGRRGVNWCDRYKAMWEFGLHGRVCVEWKETEIDNEPYEDEGEARGF
ncbi:hypothetical protein HPP92_013360 [Vanilla planifolia]|uniref:Uncharacterized protein n=1 Tax=Vanilla planifolia TaxID=51239 RepID=A0A835QUS1_VANPL|nr:hypothetical protein HPP92_013360 [Vanilla planifolia]